MFCFDCYSKYRVYFKEQDRAILSYIFPKFHKKEKRYNKNAFINIMKKNLKLDKMLQTDTKTNDVLIREMKKAKLEYNRSINFDLAHMYGSW